MELDIPKSITCYQCHYENRAHPHLTASVATCDVATSHGIYRALILIHAGWSVFGRMQIILRWQGGYC